MQHFTISKDATSVILPISIYDSSSTTGAKLAGLVYNSAGLSAYYNRMGAAGSATAISLVTATKGTFTSSGFVAIDGTNMPGDYELHIPNAALATGADRVLVQLKGATNMVPVNISIQLVAYNPQDAVRLGLTAIPNATAGGSGGVPVVGTGTNNFKSDASANVTFANTSIGTVTTLTNLPAITSNWITAAGITDGAFTAAKFAASSLNGKGDWNVGKTGYSLTATTGLGNQTANITGNLSGSVGSVTGAVGSVTGAVGSVTAGVTVTTNNDKTGYSLTQTFPANFADLAITVTTGRVTAGTVSDKTGYSISGTKTTLDALNDLSSAAVNAECDTAISDAGLATATALATVDTVVDNLNLGIIYGAAQTGTLSATQASTNLTGYADDQLIGRIVIFTSGACEGEASDITDYTEIGGVLTFTALTAAPGNGDTFKIV